MLSSAKGYQTKAIMRHKIAKQLTLFFAAGSLGGLANSLAVWLFGLLGITTAVGVQIAPVLTPDWLYPRLVWGGLWGFLFFWPNLPQPTWLKGLTLSIAPTLVQLLLGFPFQQQKGLLGVALGILTPLFVVIFNAIWGITAAYWIQYIRKES